MELASSEAYACMQLVTGPHIVDDTTINPCNFLANKVAGTVELHCCVCTMWPFSIAVSHGGRLVSHGRRPDQVCRSNTCMDATQMQSDQALMLGPFLGGLYT